MIYLFLENGFEETEAIGTLDFILRSGTDIKTVSSSDYVTGTHGITIKTDLKYEEISKGNLSGIILPGGLPGTNNLAANNTVIEYINYCNEKGLLVAAICAAPSILGQAGILKGKKATCYPSFEDKLTGAEVLNKKTVADGNIITGQAMGSVIPFGYKIVEYLKGKKAADEVLASIYG